MSPTDHETPTPVPTAVESARPDSVRPTVASTSARLEDTRARMAAAMAAAHARVGPFLSGSKKSGIALISSGRDVARAQPRRFVAVVGVVTLFTLAIPFVARRGHRPAEPTDSAATSASLLASASIAPSTFETREGVPTDGDVATLAGKRPYAPAAALAGLDLKSIAIDDSGAVASAAGGHVARLTLDPKLQLAVTRILKKHKVPQAGIVVIEPSTGKILAYGSRGGEGKDLNTEAFAPSASVFKVVTGAALVQVAGVSPDLKTCYSGGEQKITTSDLKEDPKRDLYCATVAQAMGRSINTVFARLASKKLTPPDLNAIAAQLGYGSAIPFDVPVEVSTITLPTDTLGFARTAAGFWNTTLSPLHGALLAATVADGGVMMRPYIVSEVLDGQTVLFRSPGPQVLRKAIEPATATALEQMMRETVSQGTCYKAFHDKNGKAFLPDIAVAGKTGTLNQPSPVKLFTWFVGFAPAKAPKVAIATLVVNDPVWKVKANVVAREVLQAYFALQGAPGVSSPAFD